MNGDMATFTEIRSRGFDVVHFEMYGNNLLHTACYYGRIEIADVLLRLGMDVNCRGNNGNTPLHYAANQNKPDMAMALLSIFIIFI